MDALALRAADNVATALRDIRDGEEIAVGVEEQVIRVRLAEPIAFGHKLAIRAIAEGAPVLKYGEVIGRATRAIPVGHHAHVHNIESLRGRGDLAAKEQPHGV